MSVLDCSKAIAEQANPRVASDLQWFFKTGPGEYGEGDLFHGLKVPQTRAIAKRFKDLPVGDLRALLASKYHEERFCAVVILLERFKREKSNAVKLELFQDYLRFLDLGGINNWDLVDVSAPYFGQALLLDDSLLDVMWELSRSENLWKQRAAVMFNYALIREHELRPTFELVESLLTHPHDLMHKACGWMLREAGKQDLAALRRFLEQNLGQMPRTMLRYSIEKMSKAERADWLSRK
jgi:3-methyladenine DNA glycosylase AlkD